MKSFRLISTAYIYAVLVTSYMILLYSMYWLAQGHVVRWLEPNLLIARIEFCLLFFVILLVVVNNALLETGDTPIDPD